MLLMPSLIGGASDKTLFIELDSRDFPVPAAVSSTGTMIVGTFNNGGGGFYWRPAVPSGNWGKPGRSKRLDLTPPTGRSACRAAALSSAAPSLCGPRDSTSAQSPDAGHEIDAGWPRAYVTAADINTPTRRSASS